VSAEPIEISKLRAELALVKIERDILGKATAYFAKRFDLYPLHRTDQ
jgi:transposase